MSRGFLITGATGQQGGAVVSALLAAANASSDFVILAVTRNPSSPAAQKLVALSSSIRLIKGDLDDCPALLSTAEAVHPNIIAVFSVQSFMGKGGPATEESQGKALIDACIAAGIPHIVQTSVDRGGDASSFDTPTDVPHFVSKHNIEHHLVVRTKGTATRYTILRPVAFMENFKPGFGASMFGALLRDRLPRDRKLQLISVRDIGWFGAEAMLRPGDYMGKGISIAGDEMTFEQLNELFVGELGTPFPATYRFLGTFLAYMVHDLGSMFQWMADTGYKADVKACRDAHPGMTTLKAWLINDSPFVARR